MEGFIRGGPNAKEVDLLEILPPTLKAFSSRAQQEPFADAYEEKHGRAVKRPWESPEALAALAKRNPEAHAEALRIIEARKEKLASRPAPNVPDVGMSPDRAEKELKMLWQEYTPDHPRPERLEVIKREINRCEKILGKKLTNFAQPQPKKSAIPEKVAEQLTKYLAIAETKDRKRVVSNTKNLPLLFLIRDQEEAKDIVEVAIQRIAELELA